MAQVTNRKINYHRLIPTTFEFVSLFILALAVVFIGNTKTMIDYYGLGSSDAVLKQGTSQTIATGLTKLDGFSVTDKIVTFLVWAVVGIFCFNIIQAVGRLFKELEERQEVSSNRYIHPAAFTRMAFWRQIFVDFAVTVSCLTLLALGLFVLLGYVLPIALTYTQSLLTGHGLANVGPFFIGLGMLYGWIIVLTIFVKLMVNRHRLWV